MPTSNENYLKNLGLKLRRIRDSKGWTLEQTEEHGWPSWRHLQQIETGKKRISVITLRKLAFLYNTTPDKLIKGI